MKGNKQTEIVTPLEDNVLQELHEMKREAHELIGANINNSPFEIVNLIYHYVDQILNASDDLYNDEEIENMAAVLAVAWGYAVCMEYNWEWKYLEIIGKIEKSYYILSPYHKYCCPPFYFIAKILEGKNIGYNGKNDNTILLLFNMINELNENSINEKYNVIT